MPPLWPGPFQGSKVAAEDAERQRWPGACFSLCSALQTLTPQEMTLFRGSEAKDCSSEPEEGLEGPRKRKAGSLPGTQGSSDLTCPMTSGDSEAQAMSAQQVMEGPGWMARPAKVSS